MQRVTRSTAVTVQPANPGAPGTPGFFTGGNPGSGVPATVPGYEWFNGVQEEQVGLIERAGLVPSGSDLAQVRKALDRLYGGGLTSLTTSTTLTSDDAGLVAINAAAGAVTLTLPAANAANSRPQEFTFVRSDTSANIVTIQRAAADTIEAGTSMQLAIGGRVTLRSNGSNAWILVGEVAGARSIGASGYIVLPGGLMLQWGKVTVPTSTSVTWTFPLAFPSAVYNVQATATPGATPTQEYCTPAPPSLTSVVIDNYPGSIQVDCFVLALGK